MNSLSWMIYFADRLGFLTNICLAVGLFGLLFIILFNGGSVIAQSAWPEGDSKRTWLDKEHITRRKAARRFLWLVIPFLIISSFLPSQQALYMIAGSQAAETVIVNPDTQEILGMVKAKLKDILTVEKK